jgi:hypothetical protein
VVEQEVKIDLLDFLGLDNLPLESIRVVRCKSSLTLIMLKSLKWLNLFLKTKLSQIYRVGKHSQLEVF